MSIPEIIIAIAVIFATLMVVTTAVAVWRAPNALTRANLLGPAICVALPVLVMAKLLRDFTTHGFVVNDVVRALIAITGLLVVASVSSFYMGRSVYGLEEDSVVKDPPTKQMRVDLLAEEQAAAAASKKKKKSAAEKTQAQRKARLKAAERDYNPFAPEHHPKVD